MQLVCIKLKLDFGDISLINCLTGFFPNAVIVFSETTYIYYNYKGAVEWNVYARELVGNFSQK